MFRQPNFLGVPYWQEMCALLSLITVSLCQDTFVRSWQWWQHYTNVWDVVSKSRILRSWSHFSLPLSCSFLKINFSHTMKLIWTNAMSKVSAEWGHVPVSKQCKSTLAPFYLILIDFNGIMLRTLFNCLTDFELSFKLFLKEYFKKDCIRYWINYQACDK